MKRWKWWSAWLVEWLEALAAGAVVAAAELLGAGAHAVCSWALMPLFGLVAAYRATRRGLLNYAAWIAPPAAMGLTHWLIWTYPPAPGPVLTCALVSLIGAAAGEVVNMDRRRKSAGKSTHGV